jgi:hypothetical protein
LFGRLGRFHTSGTDLHLPGDAKQHVTNPDFFPQVERAAHRVTVPLQFVGSSPLRTA